MRSRFISTRSSKSKSHEAGGRLPKSRGERGFSSKRTPSLMKCKLCGALFYKKSWHHGESALAVEEAKKLGVKLTICPADQMIKNGQFEGELVVLAVPAKDREILQNLIRGFGERAYERDCQHRIIKLEGMGKDGLRVTVTENQLAGRIAKKIKDALDRKSVV